MRKKLWKIWQTFLILSIPGSIISLFIMACYLDEDSYIPAIVMGVNLAWLCLLGAANCKGRDKNVKKNRFDGTEIWETDSNK